MVKVAGVDMLSIQEAKQEKEEAEYEASAEAQVGKLTDKISEMADKLVDAKREADKYLQAGTIMEHKEGLTILEAEKFEKLAMMIPFERSAKYLEDLETIKESIIDARGDGFEEKEEVGKLPSSAFRQAEQPDAKAVFDFGKYV